MSLFTRRERIGAPEPWRAEPIGPARDATIWHPLCAALAGELRSGTVSGPARLSDALNAAQVVRLAETGPAFGDGTARPAGVQWVEVDPREIELALGQPLHVGDAERQARRVRKNRYPVIVWTALFQVIGVLHVYPGIDPERVATGSGPRFTALTEAQVWRGRTLVDDSFDVVLINRTFIRRVRPTEFALA